MESLWFLGGETWRVDGRFSGRRKCATVLKLIFGCANKSVTRWSRVLTWGSLGTYHPATFSPLHFAAITLQPGPGLP